jgi:hypothetical protein
MRSLVGIVLAGFVGTAAAGDDTWADARYADGNDYSAKLFYSLDFGGDQGHAQSMGLRFDNVLAASRGAPALFQASFNGQAAVPSLKLQGVEVAGPAMAAGQSEGGGVFSNLTAAQWVGIAFTGLVFGSIVVEAADSDDEVPVTGSGTGS